MTKLLLASSSPYRRALLARLGMTFETASPEIDETALPGETPAALVARLARQKAAALARSHPDHLIIGCDQVAAVDDQILTKPGNHANAQAQLAACSGRTATFYTGLCLAQPVRDRAEVDVVATQVNFRQLSEAQIDLYLEREQPYDCAGSFKCEGLGIALFTGIESNDPTALVGLPLISLTTLLDRYGAHPLAAQSDLSSAI